MFHKRLKELRKRKGITQEQLAEILQLERSTVGKYESPTKPIMPSPDILHKMSDYFGVSTDYLLGRTDIEKPAPANEGGQSAELTNMINQLSEDEKRLALGILRGILEVRGK